MPKKEKPPTYRLQKSRNCAVVTIDGRDHYLGPYGSGDSYEKYARLIAEWKAAGPALPARGATSSETLTIAELTIRYWDWAVSYYRQDGKPTGHVARVQQALRVLRELYGKTEVASFGPLAMRAVQEQLIERDGCRNYINSICGTIRRVFKWAASLELLPVSVFHALQTVPGLKRGRTEARETDPVLPVSDAHIERTLPYLPPVVGDMVLVQRLIGCRPTKLCIMRPFDKIRNASTKS